MSIITDTRKCTRCGKEYEWEYRVSNQFNNATYSIFDALDNRVWYTQDKPSNGRVLANSISVKSDDGVFHLNTVCPHCGQRDRFDYDYKI